MNKIRSFFGILFGVFVLCCSIDVANAYQECSTTGGSYVQGWDLNGSIEDGYCTSTGGTRVFTDAYGVTYHVTSCTACADASGTTFTPAYGNSQAFDAPGGGYCSLTWSACVCPSRPISCTWSHTSHPEPGVYSLIDNPTWDCATCLHSYTYTCEYGYYGGGNTNCIACPAYQGIAGHTDYDSGTNMHSCYIDSGSTYTDSKGTKQLNADCYY